MRVRARRLPRVSARRLVRIRARWGARCRLVRVLARWIARRRLACRLAVPSLGALASQLLLLGGVALASFTNLAKAGPGVSSAAKLATPSGLEAADGGCAGGSTQTNVALTWGSSATLDADGGYLVGGYAVLRSTSSAGTYSTVGSLAGSPPAASYTDTNPSGAATPQLLVANAAAKTVHALNSATEAGVSVATGVLGDEPNGIAVNGEGTKAVIAEGASSQVQTLNVTTDAVGKTVAIPKVGSTSARPDAVAIAPNGTTAYVLDGANGLLYPLTISSGALGSAIAVGAQGDPAALLVTPNGADVYVANFAGHSVSVVATASKTVVATISIGAGSSGAPVALAVTPNSAHVYVADEADSEVDDIATASNTVVRSVAVPDMSDPNLAGGGDPNIMAITPDGARLYVASYEAGSVSDIATATDAVSATIALEGAKPKPNALALAPNGCQLYVHDYAQNRLDAIRVAGDTVVAAPAVAAGGDPTGMALTPDSTKLYVADAAASSVSVVEAASDSVTATLAAGSVGSAPSAILATPSPYFYKVQAQHGGWASALSTNAQIALGWNPGGWQ